MSINDNNGSYILKLNSLDDFSELRNTILSRQNPSDPEIAVCHGTGCLANGSAEVFECIKKIVSERELKVKVIPKLKRTGCHGFCSRGPLVTVEPYGFFYQNVSKEDVLDILEISIEKKQPVKRLLYKDIGENKFIERHKDIPFYKFQKRIVLRNIGKIDPGNIEDTIAYGGYQALIKALTKMTPESLLIEIEKSNLRGRGGAGFPTGIKWRSAVNASKKKGEIAYVIVNGDEGDPGAFMDRTIMEGDPHAVIEGLSLGAYAVGAKTGYIYVREEYPLAIKNLNIAITQARELGLLGDNILNTGFSFDIKINRGAGAFVCGESTALFASIEGKVGTPRPKYIRSTEEGLWGKPSVLNNVETWANIPMIVSKGYKWFSKIGTPSNTGTKVFSLVGKVNNIGLVEVPMGYTLKSIVEKIGGGLANGESFKAVQTGGPSGGCIPYSFKNISVDFDSLSSVGSMMGSGGMIVMDSKDCVIDVSRYFLKFLEEESCGKCLPCRLGLKRMKEILDRISCGKGNLQDIDDIESLSRAIQDSSLCALGGSAPNSVLTTIKYFKDEYIAHIKEKKCPAGVCQELITYYIDEKICTGCGLCKIKCPQTCINGKKKKPHKIVKNNCIKCGLCKELCKFGAVKIK